MQVVIGTLESLARGGVATLGSRLRRRAAG